VTTIWWIAAVGLLINVALGVGFLTSRRGSTESLLAALLFATTGVAFVLVLGQALGRERAVDVALVIALLSAVLGVAFVRRGWLDGDDDGGREP
jgi:multisubunit Na+/H+ antiporter MnhF subunit